MNATQTYFYNLSPAQAYTVSPKEDVERTISSTDSTPQVSLNRYVNALTIQGVSRRVDMQGFYESIVSEFKTGIINKGFGQLRLQFQMFNTSTVKVLFDLFKFLRERKEKGYLLKVFWDVKINDVDMVETAMDFSDLFGLDVKIGLME